MKLLVVFFALFFSFTGQAKEKQETLTLYTSRKTHLIEPLIKAYQAKTGVRIEHINGKAGVLLQRLKQEGESSQADVFVTVDAGNLWNAAEQGFLMPVTSKTLSKIPSQFRDPKNRWFALSLRARTLFYNKNKVKKSELKNYEDLADPKWKGKLCLRTSRKVYNQSLVAGLMDRMGEKQTQKVVEGWVANLAKPVFTSDSQLLKAIELGDCLVGIANSYYLAQLHQKGKAKSVVPFWPKKSNGGVHVNISGAGLVKTKKNLKDSTQAVKFLEWMVSPEAQKQIANLNFEYPVIETVEIAKAVQGWGRFEADPTPLSAIGPNQKKAVLLMDKAKYR